MTSETTVPEYIIRAMQAKDEGEVLAMMRVFYTSPAVLSNGTEDIFRRDLAFCLSDSPLLSGYVFAAANRLLGYGMVAPAFSTEYGGPCLWIEDLYVQPEFRGHGLGRAFFRFIEERYPEIRIFRLELEAENAGAARLYRRCGYDPLPYREMKKVRK